MTTRVGETERLYLLSPGYTARNEYLPFVVCAVHFAEKVELDVIDTVFQVFHAFVPRRFWIFTLSQLWSLGTVPETLTTVPGLTLAAETLSVTVAVCV